ncbi:MAG: DUF262 domain-containing protein [Bacteroidaceae bacterium]|nr:DUF262 domain-containing protein [Bacteroidaceae bacterium]
MKIELHEIPVRELVAGYRDSQEEGVVGYGGRLDIRPKYQREFVYKDRQRNAVIETLRKGFPLNVMYWVKNGNDSYEVLDGQQRTISICQYVAGDFSIHETYFHTLTDDQQAQILDYRLMVYFCEGTDSEKLNWFSTINIAGERLTDQELRNAVYTGPWLTSAKRFFSKNGCAAKDLSDKYVKVDYIRQELLELALEWISHDNISQYMADHQHDSNANPLWLYFQQVIAWVQTTFPTYRREMKGLPWGELFNRYKDFSLDTQALENEVARLMADDEVQKKSGIYEYVLSGDERKLNLRSFDKSTARTAYERQQGICPHCGEHKEIGQMQADHITPWSKGGKTVPENCQMLCSECNRRKSNK